MAIRAISIVKETDFRGGRQQFSNTYHYYNEIGGGAGYDEMITALVNAEKPLHSSDVQFVSARLWSAGGTDIQNETLLIKDLNTSGTAATMPEMDRERAILVQWDCGRNILGRKVYLRKWWHICGTPAVGGAWGTAVLGNTGQIAASLRGAIVELANDVNTIGGVAGVTWELCSPKGVTFKSEPVVHPYLEHHQLGDNWRN